MIEFTIPGELPTLNEIIKASKSHPMAYAKMKKDYTALVMIQAKKLPKVKKANFEFIWYCKNRRKDKDGIMVGQKFIFDGLIKAGVLENDGWNEVGDISHFFRIDKNNPRVEVRLKKVR